MGLFHTLTRYHVVLEREDVGQVALCLPRWWWPGQPTARFFTWPMLELLEQGVQVKGIAVSPSQFREVANAETHEEAIQILYQVGAFD